MKPLHISPNTAHSGCKPSAFISSIHTFIPSLPPYTCTSHPCHHHISTGRHPIIRTLTFHMPKPPQSTPPHHLIERSVHQKDCTNPHCVSYPSATLTHPSHPSHHHPFRPLQTLQIRFLHRPGLSPICQYTLNTSLVYFSLYAVWCTPGRIGDNSLNFAQAHDAHLTLALAASSTPPPAPSVSPK